MMHKSTLDPEPRSLYMPAVQHGVGSSAWCIIKSYSHIGIVNLLICKMLAAELLVRSVQHFMLYLRLGNH